MRRASNVIVQITENLQDVKNNVNSISHQQSRSFGLCTTIIPLTYLPSWNRNFCVMSVSGYISTHIWDDFFLFHCTLYLASLVLLPSFTVHVRTLLGDKQDNHANTNTWGEMLTYSPTNLLDSFSSFKVLILIWRFFLSFLSWSWFNW